MAAHVDAVAAKGTKNIFGQKVRVIEMQSEAMNNSSKRAQVVAYTDGASRGNPGPGGYGAVLVYVDASGKRHTRVETRIERIR